MYVSDYTYWNKVDGWESLNHGTKHEVPVEKKRHTTHVVLAVHTQVHNSREDNREAFLNLFTLNEPLK